MQHQIVKSQIQTCWEGPEGDLFRALVKDADSVAVRLLAGLWEISEYATGKGVLNIHARKALEAGISAEKLISFAKRVEYVVNSVDFLIQPAKGDDRLPTLSDKFKKLSYLQFKLVALNFLIATSSVEMPRMQKQLADPSQEGFKAEIATYTENESQSGSEAAVKESILKTLDQMAEFLADQLL